MQKDNLKSSNLVKSVSIETPEDLNKQSIKEYIDTALCEAKKLWDFIKEKGKDPKFVELSDKEKIDSVSLKFHAFQKEFPIVSRYLICMGQYSKKAFERYLIKIKNFKPPDVRDKDYMEDQWVRRQADYVRYLWESYQRKHYNQKEAQSIWQQAYKSLKKEFSDFKNMHSDIEKELKKTDKVNKKELVSELLKRLSSGEQTLDDESMKQLVEVMNVRLMQQRKEKAMEEIQKKIIN